MKALSRRFDPEVLPILALGVNTPNAQTMADKQWHFLYWCPSDENMSTIEPIYNPYVTRCIETWSKTINIILLHLFLGPHFSVDTIVSRKV